MARYNVGSEEGGARLERHAISERRKYFLSLHRPSAARVDQLQQEVALRSHLPPGHLSRPHMPTGASPAGAATSSRASCLHVCGLFIEDWLRDIQVPVLQDPENCSYQTTEAYLLYYLAFNADISDHYILVAFSLMEKCRKRVHHGEFITLKQVPRTRRCGRRATSEAVRYLNNGLRARRVWKLRRIQEAIETKKKAIGERGDNAADHEALAIAGGVEKCRAWWRWRRR